MFTKVTKQGEDFSVCIPRDMAEKIGLEDGDEVELCMVLQHLEIYTPAAPRIRLEDLLADITPENRHELVECGPPVGREVW